jgi:Mn2+/Fe2+ NRAMP family transporter
MISSKADPDKSPRKPVNILLRLLGPRLVTGAADDDPSGIATYSQAGELKNEQFYLLRPNS